MIVAGHRVRRVTPDDTPRVQALFSLDRDYWLHIEGAPLRDDEARICLNERPPGIELAQKHAFLVDDIALLDMIEGYPDPTTWFLGLIFLAPDVRGRGFGTKLLQALFEHARMHGARALQLAVERDHANARRLYERLGFQFVRHHRRTIYTGAFVELEVMERAL